MVSNFHLSPFPMSSLCIIFPSSHSFPLPIPSVSPVLPSGCGAQELVVIDADAVLTDKNRERHLRDTAGK